MFTPHTEEETRQILGAIGVEVQISICAAAKAEIDAGGQTYETYAALRCA